MLQSCSRYIRSAMDGRIRTVFSIKCGTDRYMLDDKRYDYDNKTHKGVDSADELAIILALRKGEKLTIDRNEHIYDSTERWIADGMRKN